MSLGIRYLTNGQKNIYVVRDELAIDGLDRFYICEDVNEIPKNIRHYAPKGEPKLVGPDLARMFGVIDILYPNFPKCGHPDYLGKNCIAESCKYAIGGLYVTCPWFGKYKEGGK